ncbi:NLR family CARD domain-containing protein 3-like isoform X2 [Colossoma macropomum]|uniref:NLR family CARD domain-containing protein 3-like isoform X2 n=1 Tax=Colossoma macropomum TaxID=42526 RepID=UPI001864EC52|nr:NLR family CARD domain-containing protein 3-like isoform X2 [Colossoma macropomum]
MELYNSSSEGQTSSRNWRTDRQLQESTCGLGDHLLKDPVSITCGHSFCRQCISSFWDHSALSETFICPQCRKRSRTHPVLHPHKASIEKNSYQPADNVLYRVLQAHKTSMKNKYEIFFEGIKTEENKTLLNRIYTKLYIIEGESEGVNEEHEVLQMEKTPRRHLQDSPINCLDIFKRLQGPEGKIEEENIGVGDGVTNTLRHKESNDEGRKVQTLRAVLTKGIAGIGKTVSMQKFILDWAEGKANQEVEFMFVLPFRELNLIKDDQYSLLGLLCDFHPELKDLDPEIYDQIKAVFIFDGLDESRIPLNFEQCEKVSDITMTSSVGVLMTNLIKGELLPSALIWITSRPAAANQIPPKYMNRVTEIQGFSDPQKEEYFRKRISDEEQAQRIISHIKTARSLHIMCHIPVFCWISATVLQRFMKQRNTEIPKTLTEMYSHFLITQTNMKNEKYEEKDERDPKNLLESNRTIILKLAELAFKQLMKGNVMFYEEDLRESSIDVTEASVYSGIFTEIFREECVLYQRKVYCFVHLSFQEFLAAVYVFHCYESKKMTVLQMLNPLDSERFENDPLEFLNSWYRERSEDISLNEVLKGAVDKAVKSQNGHLDLFLRFLLGISLESNQRLLQGLLTPRQRSSETTREHIQGLIKGNKKNPISTERSINLFLCLSEMNDQSLSRELQEYLNSERHSGVNLSPGQCSALAYMILSSEEVLDELDLKKYNISEEGYRRLIPAVTACRKARLSGCMVTDEGCSSLASALKSNPSHLRELDLNYNHPGESGVKLLSDLLEDPHCRLETLQVEHGGKSRMKPGLKKYARDLTLDPNTAATCLILCEETREVYFEEIEQQPYPDHPDRFVSCAQVLCKESLTGRCYWEAELSEEMDGEVAVTYRGIERKGNSDDCGFGNNNQSWSLIGFSNGCTVSHNNQSITIPVRPFYYISSRIGRCVNVFGLPIPMKSIRVGVYLDWAAGTLSFYSVSYNPHRLTHIHTFHSTFSEPLYAGFKVGFDTSLWVGVTE